MHLRRSVVALLFVATSSLTVATGDTPCSAQGWPNPFRLFRESADTLHRERPETGSDDAIEQLANQIDWLEHYIDRNGSIVAKHPDVWGESRLMRHRFEYEREMAAQFGQFRVLKNGALRRVDESFLGMALAMQAAATGNDPSCNPVGIPTPESSTNIFNSLGVEIPTTNDAEGPAFIGRSVPFNIGGGDVRGFTFENETISLEPTIQLDQMSRYLNHLNELRRINEGDDVADSAGYSLNLVRIPVSILPGKQTRKGYGAEITVIAEPYLSMDLLPTTFRDLVLNDVIDMLAPPLTSVVNDPIVRKHLDVHRNAKRLEMENLIKMYEEARKTSSASRRILATPDSREERALVIQDANTKKVQQETFDKARASFMNSSGSSSPMQREEAIDEFIQAAKSNNIDIGTFEALNEERKDAKTIAAAATIATKAAIANVEFPATTIPSQKSRRFRLPIPPSHAQELLGANAFQTVIEDVYERLISSPINKDTIHLMDVRNYLAEEVQASYEFLRSPGNSGLWTHVTPHLVASIREHRTRDTEQLRCNYLISVAPNQTPASGQTSATQMEFAPVPVSLQEAESLQLPPMLQGGLPQSDCCSTDEEHTDPCKSVTAILGWTIIVESALLNDRLIEDMRHVSESKGCPFFAEAVQAFFLPDPPPEARAAFIEYVKCRWPIRVFALDPVAQQQNIADEYARRRELQVAMALAFASGQINAQAMMRYTRRLEWDMATIALNQTAVGFSHGSDTFGWRFHPRFQTPPIKGSIATFCETLVGGPTTDDDLNERQLEPGMRECTAIVVMPSFVPYATFDVRTNWFRLTDPKQTEVSMKDTMVLSRSIKAMQQSAAQCAQCAHLYRDGEVHRLLRRVDQLERELPLQTMQAQIPFENTAGGFELFDTGITDLAPELIGFYGAPGINPNDRTTMYLIGDGFSVHDTNVIAGGRKVDYRLLSRQVMEVDIPRGVQILPAHPDRDDNLDEVVDVHVATPYGVSSHLLVPLAKPGAGLAGTALAWRPGAVLQTWANATKGAKASAAFEGYFSAPDALVVSYPRLLQVNDAAKILFRVQHNGVQLGGFTHEGVVVDPGASEIRIGGADLQNLVTKSATGLNALVLPYLNYLIDEKKQSGATISLQVDAAIQVGSNAPILIDGGFQVDVILKIKDPAAPSGGSE